MLLILRNSVVCFDKRKRRRIQVCSPLVCSVSFYFLLDNISVSYAILVSLHEDLNREPSIASFVETHSVQYVHTFTHIHTMCIHTYRYTCMQYTDTYTYTYTRTIREQKHKHTYRYRQLKSLSKEEDDNEVLTFLGLSFLGSFLFSHIPTSPTARLPLRSLRRRR